MTRSRAYRPASFSHRTKGKFFAGPPHQRVEPEVRLQVGEVERIARQERAQVVRLDDVPVPLVEGGPQQRRALQLVADQLGPFGGDDQEADERFVGRDPGVPAEQRLAEHRRPFDLEQEGDLAADVPDPVDLGEVLGGPADPAEVGALLALVEPIGQQSPGYDGSAPGDRSRPACRADGRRR